MVYLDTNFVVTGNNAITITNTRDIAILDYYGRTPNDMFSDHNLVSHNIAKIQKIVLYFTTGWIITPMICGRYSNILIYAPAYDDYSTVLYEINIRYDQLTHVWKYWCYRVA